MRRVLAGVFALLLMLPAVSALQTPEITFIPNKFTQNADLVMMADIGNSTARIQWQTDLDPFGNITVAPSGHFPWTSGRYMCYFSNTDSAANCGPTPFDFNGNRTMVVNAFGIGGEYSNATIRKMVGSITITPEINMVGEIVYLSNVYYSGAIEGIDYKIYSSDFNVVQSGSLTYKIESGSYYGNFTLNEGVYYLTLEADGKAGTAYEGDFGGLLKKLRIGFVEPGEGGEPGVSGFLDIESVTKDKTSSGSSLEVIILNAGDVYRKEGYRMTNIGTNNLTDLSISVSPELQSYIDFGLSKTSLLPNETALYSISVSNIQEAISVDTVAEVYSNATKIAQFPVRIRVQVYGSAATCPACPVGGAGEFSLNPGTWTGEYSVGEAVKMITISNNGEEVMTNLTYTATPPLSTILTLSLPVSVPAGGSDMATATVNSGYSSKYSGTLTISSSTGSQSMPVSLEFYSNISDDIQDKIAEIADLRLSMDSAQYNQFSTTLDDIESLLESAEEDLGFGDFSGAGEKFTEASAKLELITDLSAGGYTPPVSNGGTVTPSGDGSGNLILTVVLVAVVVAGGAAYYFLKIRKKGAPKEKYEKELEEEF